MARYPKEILRWPRSWVERQYNVVHWAVMERGGHFAAMEQPELFVETCGRSSARYAEAAPGFSGELGSHPGEILELKLCLVPADE